MKSSYYISNERPKSPLFLTLLFYLLLDKFNAPGWIWGAVASLCLLLWIVFFICINKEKPVEIYRDEVGNIKLKEKK
jgi:hypothetical protein